MRHLARVVGVAVVSAISSGLFLLADSQDQDPPRIRAGIDLVHFDVTVTDKTGTLVEGLTADDFEVLENRARQSLSVFAAGQRDAAPDLHLGILIDVSGSMGPLENVRYITLEVLNRLPEAAGYTLIMVGNDARGLLRGLRLHVRIDSRGEAARFFLGARSRAELREVGNAGVGQRARQGRCRRTGEVVVTARQAEVVAGRRDPHARFARELVHRGFDGRADGDRLGRILVDTDRNGNRPA